jgi:hypothetical protein
MREIYRLNFERVAWMDVKHNLALSIKRAKDGSFEMQSRTNVFDRTRRISGNRATAFERKLNALRLEDWDKQYDDPLAVNDDEWCLSIEFVDGGKKQVSGLNGYPNNWRAFSKMLDWLKKL